jgi:uncharacterized protein
MTEKSLLLMIGGEHHPFDAFGAFAKQLFEDTGCWRVTVTTDRNAFRADRIAAYDAAAAYTQGGHLTPAQEDGLLGFVRQGGGFAGIHCATASWKENSAWIEMINGVFISHGPVAPFPVAFTAAESPITEGIDNFVIEDERYIHDRFDPDKVQLLATTPADEGDIPMIWTREFGSGRVYYLALGHDERAYERPEFKALLLRGVEWAAG